MRVTLLKSIRWILIGACLLAPNQLRFNLEKVSQISAQASGNGTNPQSLDLRQDQQFVIGGNPREGISKEEFRPVVAVQNCIEQSRFDAINQFHGAGPHSRTSFTALRNSPLLL